MTAIGLIFGELTADHYEDAVAQRPAHRCAAGKDECVEDPRYTKEYLDADKRSIANAVQVFFKDGSSTEKVAVEYPVGHRRRRAEGMPLLMKKFETNLASRLAPARCEAIMKLVHRSANPRCHSGRQIHRYVRDRITEIIDGLRTSPVPG